MIKYVTFKDLSYIRICTEDEITRYMLNRRVVLMNHLNTAALAYEKAESNLEQYNRNILLFLGKKK